MNDLSDIMAALRTELPTIKAHWPVESLSLFGSRVRDDARPDSDLNVLVRFRQPIPLSSFLALEDRLAEITGLRIDLVSTAVLKQYIGQHVRAEAVPV